MTLDPTLRGHALAEFFREVAPRLYDDLARSGLLPVGADHAQARLEWECFALYACVRGLVAAGGFNRETVAAIDALHDDVLSVWMAAAPSAETFAARRTRVTERYAEYGTIGQDGGAAGAVTVTLRLGAAAAAHMTAPDAPAEPLATTVGELHETLVEGATETMRRLG